MSDARRESETIFTRVFGGDPAAFAFAHGRVNLIGEHTDYNQGLVLPMLISKQCHAAGDLGGRPQHCEVYSRETGELRSFRVGDESMRRQGWASYVAGVLAQLQEDSSVSVGIRIALASDVPLGSGLSSSAAIEVAIGRLVCGLLGRRIEPMRLARMCRRAEHEFAGVPCGLMDQATVSAGREDCAMMLDCREEVLTSVKLPTDFRMMVVDTGVKHALAEGAYRQRVEECRSAVNAMRVDSLRDANESMLTRIDDLTVRRRAAHVISENRRVVQAVEALKTEDVARFGRLMIESHESLRDNYEVSCTESDRLVEVARATRGVLGARMTGGGFGGCVIVVGSEEGLRRFSSGLGASGGVVVESICRRS